MKYSYTTLAAAALVGRAAAYPAIAEAAAESMEKRQYPGATPGFNAAYQYVSNTGAHAFVAPGPTDARGPCPGLNAMANHAYFPHNGVGTIEDFVQGCYAAFGMGLDLGGFLGVYGAIFDGNLESYSIGGPSENLPVINGLLGTPQGLSGSHNNYENDASPIRGDLWKYGNDYKNHVSLFSDFVSKQSGVPLAQQNYGLDIIADFRKERFDNSIATNPYFFNGIFSGIIASPAAYTFIYRFMANKSAEYPEGRLDENTLKYFYSMKGSYPNYKYTPGYESFPDNWYKRAEGDEYTIPYFAVDAIEQDLKYPEFASFGGNTGKVNSFAGFDPSNITSGVYNLQNLGKGNNALCYGFEVTLQEGPSLLEGLFLDITPANNMLTAAIANATSQLNCPKLAAAQYNQFSLKQYPGYSKKYKGYTPPKTSS